MQPTIKDMPGFIVVGMEYVGKNQHREISQLWEVFNPRRGEIPHLVQPLVAFGVTGVMRPDGTFSYLAGYAVSAVEQLPAGMTAVTVPPARYAVFTHRGPLFGVPHDLDATYQYIYHSWLPASGFKRANTPAFEWYDERFEWDSAESEMDIYIPLE